LTRGESEELAGIGLVKSSDATKNIGPLRNGHSCPGRLRGSCDPYSLRDSRSVCVDHLANNFIDPRWIAYGTGFAPRLRRSHWLYTPLVGCREGSANALDLGQ